MKQRIYFLDNLKWCIIWLMVVFHAALCYMAYAPQWWYVVDQAEPVFSATLFVCWCDVFIMPVMFFISGYFGWRSFSRRKAQAFWHGKVSRILLPWIVGSMCIAPFVTYIILGSRGVPMGFLDFYQNLFWGVLYEQAQYWYLGALTALYILLQLLCAAFPGLRREDTVRRPGGWFFALLFILPALGVGLYGIHHPVDTWSYYAYLLVLQPARIPLYIAYFMAGAWACRQQWFAPEGYVPGAGGWSAAFLLASFFYLWQKFCLPPAGTDAIGAALLNGLAFSAACLSAVLALLGVFHRWLDFTNSGLSNLSQNSYGVYYLHMLVVFSIAWGFLGIGLSVYLKYACVCGLSLVICYLAAKYILCRVPGFDR